MIRWARAVAFESAAAGVCSVGHVVGAVEVLAVPAAGRISVSSDEGVADVRWEPNVGHDASGTGLLRHVSSLAGASRCVLEAGECELAELRRLLGGAVAGVADLHTEALP